jgi:hypothetical protein
VSTDWLATAASPLWRRCDLVLAAITALLLGATLGAWARAEIHALRARRRWRAPRDGPFRGLDPPAVTGRAPPRVSAALLPVALGCTAALAALAHGAACVDACNPAVLSALILPAALGVLAALAIHTWRARGERPAADRAADAAPPRARARRRGAPPDRSA